MFKAIGFLIVLWGLSSFFTNAFEAFEDAATESFRTVEVLAKVAQVQIVEKTKKSN